MKLDDVLEMLESESEDERKARRKAVYFNLHETDETQHQFNRKSKRAYDDETAEITHQEKRRLPRYERTKRQ